MLIPFAEVAERHGCNMAQLALAWLLAQRNNKMVPIPGTKDIQHMKENAGAAEVTLDSAAVGELDQLINENVVVGARYTDNLMQSVDSERD